MKEFRSERVGTFLEEVSRDSCDKTRGGVCQALGGGHKLV